MLAELLAFVTSVLSLWSAPEPGTLVLLGAGVLVLLFYRRRRHRRR